MRQLGGYVQINAHYTRDLERTYRASARLRRGAFNGFRVLCVLLVLLAGLGAWSGAFSLGTAVFYTILDILACTSIQSTTIEWSMVKRVLETGDCWIFIVNRLQAVTLYKAALTSLQRDQLTAFLNTRN